MASMASTAAEQKASDLFLKENAPPTLRVHGKVRPLDLPKLTAEDVREYARPIYVQKIQRLLQVVGQVTKF